MPPKKSLQGEIRNQVAEGVTVCSDNAKGYGGPDALGYRHETATHSQKATDERFVFGAAHTILRGGHAIESVRALLQHGFTGTFHHRTRKHAMPCLNEFAFCPNESNGRIETIDRMRALVEKTIGRGLTCEAPITREAT